MSLAAATSEIKQLGSEYQALKDVKGAWQDSEFNAQVDSPTGRKYEVMKQLGTMLNGTSYQTVLETLGQPDEVEVQNASSLPLMPGPWIPQSDYLPADEQGNLVLKYYWRFRHDYLYFVVDMTNESQPAKSGWYHAGE